MSVPLWSPQVSFPGLVDRIWTDGEVERRYDCRDTSFEVCSEFNLWNLWKFQRRRRRRSDNWTILWRHRVPGLSHWRILETPEYNLKIRWYCHQGAKRRFAMASWEHIKLRHFSTRSVYQVYQHIDRWTSGGISGPVEVLRIHTTLTKDEIIEEYNDQTGAGTLSPDEASHTFEKQCHQFSY